MNRHDRPHSPPEFKPVARSPMDVNRDRDNATPRPHGTTAQITAQIKAVNDPTLAQLPPPSPRSPLNDSHHYRIELKNRYHRV